MTAMSITEARRRLSEMVRRVAAGETLEITRHGRPVARLSSVPAPRKPIDLAMLRSVTESTPRQAGPAAVLVRKMRDDDRY